MISATRISPPSVLKNNAHTWLFKLNNLKLDPHINQSKITQAQNKYRHRQIKDALVEMFYGKCAYCESKITVVTYGAIEHFFPKSLYPDLTFEWTNLLLSCDICNNSRHKGTKFPLDSQGNPLLIDPTDGKTNPNTHLEFVWDDVTQIASIYGKDEKGKVVEDIFDFNGMRGRRELIYHRSQYLKKLFVLLRLAQQTQDLEAISLLKEACQPDAEYSAFTMSYILPYLPI